jgi:hypothetical protein
MRIPANDIYVGDNKVINADGTLVATASVTNGAITAAKLADNAVETAKIKNASVTAGKLATDAVETDKIKDKNVTLAKLADTAKTNILTYQIEALTAGDDITNRVIFEVPTGFSASIESATIIPQGNATVDGTNTCTIKLTNGANEIVSKEYNDTTAFPAASYSGSLGAPSATHKELGAGEKLSLSVTNASSAATPGIMLIVTYTVADAT